MNVHVINKTQSLTQIVKSIHIQKNKMFELTKKCSECKLFKEDYHNRIRLEALGEKRLDY